MKVEHMTITQLRRECTRLRVEVKKLDKVKGRLDRMDGVTVKGCCRKCGTEYESVVSDMVAMVAMAEWVADTTVTDQSGEDNPT